MGYGPWGYKGLGMTGDTWIVSQGTPRNTKDHQQLKEARNGECGPAETLVLVFGTQNCDRINLCVLKSSGLWYFVAAVLEIIISNK